MSILRKHHFLNNCKIIWPQNKRVNLSWTELYLFSSRIWLHCICMHVSSAKENVKQYPQSLHPPTFRHALNLQKKFMYTVFEGKTGCDQLKGTCIKWPNIWSFDNDTRRRESPARYPKEAKRTTMKLYHTGQGFETCTSTCTALL